MTFYAWWSSSRRIWSQSLMKPLGEFCKEGTIFTRCMTAVHVWQPRCCTWGTCELHFGCNQTPQSETSRYTRRAHGDVNWHNRLDLSIELADPFHLFQTAWVAYTILLAGTILNITVAHKSPWSLCQQFVTKKFVVCWRINSWQSVALRNGCLISGAAKVYKAVDF